MFNQLVDKEEVDKEDVDKEEEVDKEEDVLKHIGVLEDAGVVSRSRDAQRRPAHLEAEVSALMTKWIDRYRRRVEERYQRLDTVLETMPDESGTNTGGMS